MSDGANFAKLVRGLAEKMPDWQCPDCGGNVLRGSNTVRGHGDVEHPTIYEGKCQECGLIDRLDTFERADDD